MLGPHHVGASSLGCQPALHCCCCWSCQRGLQLQLLLLALYGCPAKGAPPSWQPACTAVHGLVMFMQGLLWKSVATAQEVGIGHKRPLDSAAACAASLYTGYEGGWSLGCCWLGASAALGNTHNAHNTPAQLLLQQLPHGSPAHSSSHTAFYNTTAQCDHPTPETSKAGQGSTMRPKRPRLVINAAHARAVLHVAAVGRSAWCCWYSHSHSHSHSHRHRHRHTCLVSLSQAGTLGPGKMQVMSHLLAASLLGRTPPPTPPSPPPRYSASTDAAPPVAHNKGGQPPKQQQHTLTTLHQQLTQLLSRSTVRGIQHMPAQRQQPLPMSWPQPQHQQNRCTKVPLSTAGVYA